MQRYEGFIIMQFLNTTRVPEMAHPIENSLGSGTSPRRHIFQLINHRMNETTATITASIALCRSAGTASFPAHQHSVCPTKILLALPLGPMSALLAFALALRPSASPTLASSASPGSTLPLSHYLCLFSMYSRPCAELPLTATDHWFDSPNKTPLQKNELTDQFRVSPTDLQVSSYTFLVESSMTEIKSLINSEN